MHYERQPQVIGQRHILNAIFKEKKGLFYVLSQELCDLVRMILKKGWLYELQLEEIC